MFFKDDFNHLSPNIRDNHYLLIEKFKKELRRGDKGRLEKLLAKKEKRLDALEAKNKRLRELSYPAKIDPNDPVVGTAGGMLDWESKKELSHLRDINKIKAALREQMMPKEGENTLDIDFQEKQKKKDEIKAQKVERQIEKVDDEADQSHI